MENGARFQNVMEEVFEFCDVEILILCAKEWNMQNENYGGPLERYGL